MDSDTTPRGTAPVRRGARLVLDTLLPPRCPGCGSLVGSDGGLCAACWGAYSFIAEPMCAACGLPFDIDTGSDPVCGACLRDPPPFDRARAAFVYDEHSRELLLSFKHADRTDAAPALARMLVRAGAGLIAEADLIVPVPLHWTRLFRRRYNQAAMLALGLGRIGGKPVDCGALVRRRRTRSQGGLGASGRRDNVRGAFALGRRAAARIAGRRIVLVDDVYTTGATVAACARTLRRGGAAAVDVLTLARVVRPAV